MPIETDADVLNRRLALLTRERDAAIAAGEVERERNAVLMQQCEHLASEIFAWRRRHTHELDQKLALSEEARTLTLRLTHALATIANMERSAFWRTRLLWVRLRNLIS